MDCEVNLWIVTGIFFNKMSYNSLEKKSEHIPFSRVSDVSHSIFVIYFQLYIYISVMCIFMCMSVCISDYVCVHLCVYISVSSDSYRVII